MQFPLVQSTLHTNNLVQHFGSVEHHFHTISSPLATQIPQAAGVGFALKRDPERRNKNIACVFFGEGAASEGDFHAGMLLASTIPSPTLFLARNNGFAISTPAHEQFHGDGIAARGPGYGVETVRVDGNDILAVFNAVKEARRRCLESGRAVLVEAMTYRVGHHSTSDDSFAYRGRQEVENWKKIDNPITRFRLFMESRGWWNEKEEEELKAKLRNDVITTLKRAETLKQSDLRDLFTDVYGGDEPWNLVSRGSVPVHYSTYPNYRESREKSSPAFSRSTDQSGSPGGKSSSDLGMKARNLWIEWARVA